MLLEMDVVSKVDGLLQAQARCTSRPLQLWQPRHVWRPGRVRSSLVGRRVRTERLRSESAVSSLPVVAAASAGAGTVRIIVKGRKLEVTDAIKDYVDKKIAHALNHYASSVKSADVTLSVRGGDTGTKGSKEQKTEVTVWTLRNGVVRSEVSADNLYASIDLVCDKLERKMQKVKEIAMAKGKWPGTGGRKGGAKITEVDPSVTESLDLDKEPELEPEIVRTKYFNLEAITPVEAAERLEMLGHDFHVFRDQETGDVQVVYKRKEHGYGVIIPLKEAARE